MYINITRFAGAAGKIEEAAPKVQQGFVPMLKGQPGFHGYAAFASEQGDIVSCTIWESAAAAANSREDVRGWVRRNLPASWSRPSASPARSVPTPSSRRRAAAPASLSTAW